MATKETDRAIGLVETRGIVALAAGVEAMVKTADVECIAIERIGAGYVAAAMQGSLAAIRQAVDSGSTAVQQYGELRGARIYPKPDAEATKLLANESSDRLGLGSGIKGK